MASSRGQPGTPDWLTNAHYDEAGILAGKVAPSTDEIQRMRAMRDQIARGSVGGQVPQGTYVPRSIYSEPTGTVNNSRGISNDVGTGLSPGFQSLGIGKDRPMFTGNLDEVISGLGNLGDYLYQLPLTAIRKGAMALGGTVGKPLATIGRQEIGSTGQKIGSAARDALEAIVPAVQYPGWWSELSQPWKNAYNTGKATFRKQWNKSPEDIQYKSELGGPWQADIIKKTFRDVGAGIPTALLPAGLATAALSFLPGTGGEGPSRSLSSPDQTISAGQYYLRQAVDQLLGGAQPSYPTELSPSAIAYMERARSQSPGNRLREFIGINDLSKDWADPSSRYSQTGIGNPNEERERFKRRRQEMADMMMQR